MNFQKPNFFALHELVPKEVYKEYERVNKLYRLWYVFDPRMLFTIDRLRERYGKMIMNNWFWGGNHQYRGWRDSEVKIGASLSQHKFGRAADLVSVEHTAEEIRNDILADPFHDDFKYITCIELAVLWLHFDIRNFDKEKYGVLVVNP